jgi:hypothetical protein
MVDMDVVSVNGGAWSLAGVGGLTEQQMTYAAELGDGYVTVDQDGTYQVTCDVPFCSVPLVRFRWREPDSPALSPRQHALELRRNRNTGPADRRRLDNRK